MARPVFTGRDGERQDYDTRRRIQGLALRKVFLQDCLAEKVLPKCISMHFSSDSNPFPHSAHLRLKEMIEQVTYEIEALRGNLLGVQMSHQLVLSLKQEYEAQKVTHRRRLEAACVASKWSTVVRDDLVTNLSSKPLTPVQLQALSLGGKFDTGICRKDIVDVIQSNYRTNTSSIEKGFIQGVAMCTLSAAKNQPSALPRRHVQALKDLGKDRSLAVVPADKGGGLVILDRIDYVNKMLALFNDPNVYRKTSKADATKRSVLFNREARRILSKTKAGCDLRWLLEESPRTPFARGNIKNHKRLKPARPIIDGTGAAPHRLSRKLGKTLTLALNKISGRSLKNTADLMSKIANVPTRCKRLVSFDVKSLFTSVPIADALAAAALAVDKIGQENLPLPRDDFLELVELCVRFGVFEFEGEHWVQLEGLAMGSPLSAILAQLVMETLESQKLIPLLPANSIWYRYVDDIIAIIPLRTNVNDLLQQLNGVHPDIQFTVEEEENDKIPFLDTILHKEEGKLAFSVYRKPTHKDDYVHYYSAHRKRIKETIAIGFFLRALRISSPHYLEEEMSYVISAFQRLKYPRGLLLKLRRRAEAIHNRASRTQVEGQAHSKGLTLPSSPLTESLQRDIGPDTRIAASSGVKIANLVMVKRPPHQLPLSNVYQVPCGGCEKYYVGETGRGFYEARKPEHMKQLEKHELSNAFVQHVEKERHVPRWDGAKIIAKGITKTRRKIYESATIATVKNINQSPGSHELAEVIVRAVTRLMT